MVLGGVRFPSPEQRRQKKRIEMQAVEKYNGNIVVQAAWLVESGVMSYDMYKWNARQHHIRVVRRGGNGRTALVDYQSMSPAIKRRITEVLGCEPTEAIKKTSLLLDVIRNREAQCKDMEAGAYYGTITDKSGRLLAEEKVSKLYNGARILNAISDCLEMVEAAATMRKQRFSIQREFEKFSYNLSQELNELYPNSLPLNSRRLLDKWKEYKECGYDALVHGLTGKEGNRKGALSEEDARGLAAVISELSAQGNKLSDVTVAELLAHAGLKVSSRRVQEIRTKNNLINKAQREGVKNFRNTELMQVDRIRPSQPMLMWCSDGWDAELYYRNEKSRFNRLTIVVVTDCYNDYPMGYAIGDRENGELIIEAYKNALRHAEELFGMAVMPYQIQSDNYAKSMLTPYYTAICKAYTPAAVGNAKSKPIEQYFRTLQSRLAIYPNYSGHNITAKKQPNDEFTNSWSAAFPDRDGVIMQLHSLMSMEREAKRAALMEAWAERNEAKVVMLDRVQYLMQFGEVSRGNMLTPNGIKLIRDSKEYKYECRDIRMREQRGERWRIHYDLGDMNQVVAVSEDGRSRFLMEAKKKVHMALADCTAEDFETLADYRGWNEQLLAHVSEGRSKNQVQAAEFIERKQLYGTLAGRLLTEGGQHKDLKAAERKRLAVAAEQSEKAERQAVKREKKQRRVEDIYEQL